MKRCSSWNWDTLDYTYWQCPGEQSAGGWNPPAPKPRARVSPGIGMDIEAALPKLPQGCRMVGKGASAIGQIVKQGSTGIGDMSMPGFSVDWLTIGKYATIGLLGFAVAAWIASGIKHRKEW